MRTSSQEAYERLKQLSNTRKVQIPLTMIQIGLAISSILSVISIVALLRHDIDHLESLLHHWKTPPITSIEFEEQSIPENLASIHRLGCHCTDESVITQYSSIKLWSTRTSCSPVQRHGNCKALDPFPETPIPTWNDSHSILIHRANTSWIPTTNQSNPVIDAYISWFPPCVGTTPVSQMINPQQFQTPTDVIVSSSPSTIQWGKQCVVDNETPKPIDERFQVFASTNFDISQRLSNQTVNISCRTQDSLCNAWAAQTHQSVWNMLSQFSSLDTRSLYIRTYIPWATTCRYSQSKLHQMHQQLDETVQWVDMVTIINIVTNAATLLIYTNVLLNLVYGDSPCCPLTDTQEQTILRVAKSYIDGLGKLARIVPIVILTVQVSSQLPTWYFWSPIDCSDAFTNRQLETLRQGFMQVFVNASTTVTVDVASLILTLSASISICKQCRHACAKRWIRCIDQTQCGKQSQPPAKHQLRYNTTFQSQA